MHHSDDEDMDEPLNVQRSMLEGELPGARHTLPGANGWAAIDAIPIAECLLSPFAYYDDVPSQHSEALANAVVDVLTLWRDAEHEADQERALKWLLALHDMLLRLPPRGGRRGRGHVSNRQVAHCQAARKAQGCAGGHDSSRYP